MRNQWHRAWWGINDNRAWWGIHDNTILFDRAVSQPYCSWAVPSLDLLCVVPKVIIVVVQSKKIYIIFIASVIYGKSIMANITELIDYVHAISQGYLISSSWRHFMSTNPVIN